MDRERTSEEYVQRLEELRVQYGIVTKKMEDLMKENKQNLILNFQEQLNKLMKQRDYISQQMSLLFHGQRVLQHNIDMQKKAAHKAVISQVERLLNIKITDTRGFEYNSQMKTPRNLTKDISTLGRERVAIIQQLDGLYNDSKLDYEQWQEMKKEVKEEFDEMFKNAPRPLQSQNFTQTQQELTQNIHTNDFVESFNRKFGVEQFDEGKTIQLEGEKLKEGESNVGSGVWRNLLEEKYGVDNPNFDLDEILRQQEINEMQRRQAENIEFTERSGRRMM